MVTITNKIKAIVNRALPGLGFKLGDFLQGIESGTGISDDGILAGKIKTVNRDLVVAIGATNATATNAADIDGVPQTPHFIAATPDATATEIRSIRFVPATGALTVTVNAAATAATTIRVPITQAA